MYSAVPQGRDLELLLFLVHTTNINSGLKNPRIMIACGIESLGTADNEVIWIMAISDGQDVTFR